LHRHDNYATGYSHTHGNRRAYRDRNGSRYMTYHSSNRGDAVGR